MRQITHTNGITISFGFNVLHRRAERGIVCWDNGCGSWDAREGGGFMTAHEPITIEPEFVLEHEGRIIAYQPGLMVEMTYIGAPQQFAFRYYRPQP